MTLVAAAGPHAAIAVSVLVPAKDEAENLPLFMELAAAAFATSPYSYEVVVIDDGSVDGTWSVLQRLAGQYPFLRAVRHRSRRGIADALIATAMGLFAAIPAVLAYNYFTDKVSQLVLAMEEVALERIYFLVQREQVEGAPMTIRKAPRPQPTP